MLAILEDLKSNQPVLAGSLSAQLRQNFKISLVGEEIVAPNRQTISIRFGEWTAYRYKIVVDLDKLLSPQDFIRNCTGMLKSSLKANPESLILVQEPNILI